MKPNLRIVKVSAPEEFKSLVGRNVYYKIQERFLGFLWWKDLTEPEDGMTYPTFGTLDEAKSWVASMYFLREEVVMEIHVENL